MTSVLDLKIGDCYDDPDEVSFRDQDYTETDRVVLVPCRGAEFEVVLPVNLDSVLPSNAPYPAPDSRRWPSPTETFIGEGHVDMMVATKDRHEVGLPTQPNELLPLFPDSLP